MMQRRVTRQLTLSKAYPKPIQALVDEFAARRPLRATSLIITLFGDLVSQHGGAIWLGSLVRAMAPLGVSERLVRTSVFRLVQEGWLEGDRVGRRSYYRFSEYGAHEYGRTARQIYGQDDGQWNGRWQLLIPLEMPDESRERFRRSLSWQGFRSIAPGTFAKPGEGGAELQECLEEFSAVDKVVLMEAGTLPGTSAGLIRALVHRSWELDQVAEGYQQFLARFTPLQRWLRREPRLEAEAAFVARTLLIHDYRRILLRDTRLPAELLPERWPGVEAQELTAGAYRVLSGASLEFVTGNLEGSDGPLPPGVAAFRRRFPE